MVRMELSEMVNQMHSTIKQSSDSIKKHIELDNQAEEMFEEVVDLLCEKYNVKRDENDYDYFNADCDGSFRITLFGDLNQEQIMEIKKLTKACHLEIEDGFMGLYTMYIFNFDFNEYWGVEYQ